MGPVTQLSDADALTHSGFHPGARGPCPSDRVRLDGPVAAQDQEPAGAENVERVVHRVVGVRFRVIGFRASDAVVMAGPRNLCPHRGGRAWAAAPMAGDFG